MRKVFFIALFALVSISFNVQSSNNPVPNSIDYSDYCEGWSSGYCEGYKDVKGSMAICPITPICPIAEIGKSRYTDGYNRGFKAGRAAAND